MLKLVYGNFPLRNTGWFTMTPTKQKSTWVGAMDTDYPDTVQIGVKVDCYI